MHIFWLCSCGCISVKVCAVEKDNMFLLLCSSLCCSLWLKFKMECQVVEGDWWRMWALTCWGHRRHGTESINGVTVSEKKRTDVIAMCARGIILQDPTVRVVSLPFFNIFICILEINWVALSLAVSVGLPCRDIKSSSMTQPLASLKFLFIYHSNTHMHAHTQRLNVYSPFNNTPKCPQERKGGGGGYSMGEGEWQRYHIPVCITVKMWGAGQRKEGGWDKGGKEMWGTWLWGMRENQRMLEVATNDSREEKGCLLLWSSNYTSPLVASSNPETCMVLRYLAEISELRLTEFYLWWTECMIWFFPLS